MERTTGSRLKLFRQYAVTVLLLLLLLLLCICKIPAALAQSPSEFLNIDCGATASSVDSVTGFTWVPDAPYVSSGKAHSHPLAAFPQNSTEMRTLRYFDDQRPKNCYTLPVTADSMYLLRATFFYGNYDNANQFPTFQLAIDATTVDNVTSGSKDGSYFEYHYLAQGNVTFLCLIRTSLQSTPFISGISLKPATPLSTGFTKQYIAFLEEGVIMKTRLRVNYGGTKLIRAPDDFYDRFWVPEGPASTYYLEPTTSSYSFLSTNSTFLPLVDQATSQPSAVMQTAVTSPGTIASLLMAQGWTNIETSLYVSVNYGELINSSTPAPRNFTLQVLDFQVTIGTNATFLHYSGWNIWASNVSVGPNSVMTMTPLSTSLAGPILNCMEVFARSDPRASKTVAQDVLAIEDIKQNLNLTEWTGDPCLPSPHAWITCSSSGLPTTEPHILAVNLSGYQLEGVIPASFANLVDLNSLSLDNNNLSGPLPAWLSALPSLRLLDVQRNNFSGPIPDALLSANSPIRFTYRPGNALLTGGVPEPDKSGNGGGSNVAAIVGASIGGVLGLILIVIIAIVAYRRCRRKPESSDNPKGRPMRIATTGGAKAYTFAEVTAATNHFNRELGKGGFGPVYYGKLHDGQEVAVKVSDGSSKQGQKEFFNEVDVLSRVHHKNLVALVGYCQEKKQILIYKYMHNGSLFDHLHGSSATVSTLRWITRLHIALNAAQGLEYLHTGCSPSFIHRDVKSSNILLTSKYDAKVADFGLTKLLGEMEGTKVMTDVMGTAGYLDPEYCITQYISSKSDVFSFGIVLLELITGCLPIDRSATVERNPHLAEWVRERLQSTDIDSVVDPVVRASNPNMDAVWKVTEIAMQSVEPKGVHRPTMTEVVQELQAALMLEGSTAPAALHMQRQQQQQLPSGYSGYSEGAFGSSSLPSPR